MSKLFTEELYQDLKRRYAQAFEWIRLKDAEIETLYQEKTRLRYRVEVLEREVEGWKRMYEKAAGL